MQLESYQDRREARLADLRRGGGRMLGGGGSLGAAPPPLPLPLTAAPDSHGPVARPGTTEAQPAAVRLHATDSPSSVFSRWPQRLASRAALGSVGTLMAEPVSLPSVPATTAFVEAGVESEAVLQPHTALAGELQEHHQDDSAADEAVDAASASGDGVDAESPSGVEEDGTAVNACKALLYAAANAVLFGVARLLHGTFTSY